MSEVEEITRGIQFPNDGDVVLKSSGPLTKSVLSIDEVTNSNGLTSFYIINYEGGGYILLSADRRSIPILGFYKDNSFIVNEEIYTVA
ncbi:MAG: Spi family protease inhibitor [Bacteroidales bacterium]